jgi:hypothetical protein
MSLAIDILKSGSDSTNNGVSSRAVRGTIYRTMEEYRNDPFRDAGEANFLVKSKVIRGGNGVPYVYCVPIVDEKEVTGSMAGGNFAYSCDSRFRERINEYPISIHDRIEH